MLLKRRYILLFALLIILIPDIIQAYIGPGAGFAFVGSFFVLFISILLSILAILFMPFRLLLKRIFGKKPEHKRLAKRVFILGFDGMDFNLTSKWMEEGHLPNFLKLKNEGSFKPLAYYNPTNKPCGMVKPSDRGKTCKAQYL